MPLIFISYRRDDSWDATWRIHEHLQRHFNPADIFIDVDSIPPGVDFRAFIQESLHGCQAMLVIIGEQWLSALDKSGRRRLDQPGDLVRVELEWAMENRVPIVPVLIRKATMPVAEQLPVHLAEIAFINAATVRSSREFPQDMERLMQALQNKGVAIKPVTKNSDEGNPGNCQKCGRQNQLNRRVCGRCREPLWEPCVACGFENGTWDVYCGQCGVQLLEALNQRIDKLNQSQETIAALRQECRYEETVRELDRIAVVGHPRLKSYAEWANNLLPTIQTEWTEAQQLRQQLLKDAQRDLVDKRFAEAADKLLGIPVRLRTLEDEHMLAATKQKLVQVEELCHAIERAVEARNLAEAWRHASSLFQLEPDVEFVRARLGQAIDLTYRTARANFAAHKYERAAKSIELVPGALRDEAMNQLHQEANRKQEEAKSLAVQIREARRAGATHQLFSLLPRFLELQPEHKEGRTLLDSSIRKVTDTMRQAWTERKDADQVIQLANVIPPALRSEEIQRGVRQLREHDPEFREGKLAELFERTLSQSQALTDERKFQQAMQLVEELPETPTQLAQIKYLVLMQVKGAQELDESYRRAIMLANEKQYGKARDLIRRLPDQSDELKNQKKDLLKQIDQVELHEQVEKTLTQCQGLVEKRNFRQAKEILRALPDQPDDVRELKKSLRKRINEAENFEKVRERMQDKRFEEALPLLSQALEAHSDDPMALFLRCQCFASLDRLAEARADLDRFKQLAADSPEGHSAAAHLAQYMATLAVAKHRDQASELMHRDRFADAMPLLNQAVKTAPEDIQSLFMRCQALMSLNRLPEARSDLDRFKRLAVDLPEAQDAALQLGRNMAALEEMIQEYGNPQAFELRNQAVQAFNSENHDAAVLLLRRALVVSGGAAKLRQELSLVLLATGVQKVNAVRASASPNALREALDQAEALLREAIEHDPTNKPAMENLSMLRKFR